MLNLKHNDYDISLTDEPMYSFESVDNVRTYEHEYILGDDRNFASKYRLRLSKGEQIIHSCLLAASGWGTDINFQSAIIIDESIYVAVGNVVCSLKLPSLALQWWQKVDFATCFRIHYLSREDCLITHGECSISRITKKGEIIWCKSGKDIFTEGFEIKGDYIEAIDFNHEKYRICVRDGQIELVS